MRITVWLAITALLAASACLGAPKKKSGFVRSSDGVRLHYLEAGSGPALLLVPGWTMPAEIWQAQIDGLSKSYRVVALDPRSQGRSDRPTGGHTPSRRAQDIKEVVDRLRLAPVALAGWSLGVPEVLTYVQRFGTSSLRAVILVDGSVGGDPNLEQIKGSTAFLKSVQEDRPKFTEGFVRGMYKKPQPEDYYRRITQASMRTPVNSAVVLLFNIFFVADWRGVLADIDRPLLFTGTARMKNQGEIIKQRAPSARIEIFEDCGHALFVDDAPRFNRVLDDFLRNGR